MLTADIERSTIKRSIIFGGWDCRYLVRGLLLLPLAAPQADANHSRTWRYLDMTYVLWTVQGLLALLFLALGSMKLISPLDELSAQMGVPGPLILFVGISEVLGAIGLILPGLLKIKPGLTPLAAAGLTLITLGATGLHVLQGEIAVAIFPLIVAALSAFVAYGRWQLAPLGERAESRTLSAAR
ncbi:MAG: DoxX family protein [Chloroflexota bacterium]